MTTLAEALDTGRGIERAFHCHVHDNTRTPSASVNVQLGLWVCYSCGAAGRLDGKDTRANAVVGAVQHMFDDTATIEAIPEDWLYLFDIDHPSSYWVERVGSVVALANNCGTHPTTGNPTYPIRDPHGRVLGVVERDPDSQPKYKYPPGIPVSKCLYGYEVAQPKQPLLVVEGASDVMAAQQRSNGDIQAVGCYGAGIKMPQMTLINALRPTLVVVAFDGDTAGRRATRQAVEDLDNAIGFEMPDGTDIDTCDDETWTRLEETVGGLG